MEDKELSDSISILTEALCDYQNVIKNHKHGDHSKSHDRLATKQDLENIENKIMSTLKQYADTSAKNYTNIESSIVELQYDVKVLNSMIQSGSFGSGSNGSGSNLSTADQALLDALATRSLAIVNNLDALATAAGVFAGTFPGSGSNNSGSNSGSYPYSGSNSGSVPGQYTGSVNGVIASFANNVSPVRR